MYQRTQLNYAEFALSFLKGRQGRIPLKAITTAYEEKTGKKISSAGATKAIKKLEKQGAPFKIKRHEQLWLILGQHRFKHPVPKTRGAIFKNLEGKLACCNCGFNEEKALHVHHINKNRRNNTPANLCILCPNCHALHHKGAPIHITSLGEQLSSMHGMYICAKDRAPEKIHSAHKLRFSIGYTGNQPLKGANIRPFGRYKTQKQAIFKISDRVTIIAFRNKLNVWIHRPAGILTKQQLINAKAEGFTELLRFCKQRDLRLRDEYLNQLIQSHHVLEPKDLNKALKPFFDKYGTEIKDRIGSDFCETSHKGKLEHEGNKRVTGAEIAIQFEKLVRETPQNVEKLLEVEGKYHDSISLYDEQIRKHLHAVQRIAESMERFNKLLEEKL